MESSFLRQYLSSNDNYQRTEEIKQIMMHSDIKQLKQLQLSIAQILIDQNESPTTKLMAIKLNKELVETFNVDYIFLLQKTLLPIYEEIAKYKFTSDDPDRGMSYFLKNEIPNTSNRDLQLTGQQFVRVIQECIRVWSRWFPLDFQSYYLSSYKITYEKLARMGVKFPPILYFDNIEQNIPNYHIPLSMIIQLRELLKKQLNTNTQQLKNQLAMNPAHYFYQHKYSTYRDFFRQIKSKNPIQKNKILRKATFQLEKEFENIEQLKNDYNSHPLSTELLQIENLCLQNLNNILTAKVPELQSQVIQLQNKINLLEKQLLEKNEKINELQTELKLLQQQKFTEIQNFLNQNDLSNSELFQTDITRMKLHYGLFDQNHEIDKYKYLLSQADYEIQELSDKLDDQFRKKTQLQEDNKTLNQTILVLERKLLMSNKQTQKPLVSQQNLSEYKQTATAATSNTTISKKTETAGFQNSIIIALRQQIKHQKSFIQNLQSMVKKLTSSSMINIDQTIFQTNLSLSKQKETFHTPSTTYKPKSRGSKEIQPPFVNYNGKIFSILPEAFTVKFRQACLLQKTILFQDDNLQIGVQTNLQQNQQLLINLVFHNRSKEMISNFNLNLRNAQNVKLQTYPQKIQQSIKSNEQVSFKVFIQLEDAQYQLVEFSIKYQLDKEYCFNLCLPCTINKFILFQELPQEFPKSYFYNSKFFITSFQNQLSSLLPDFQIIQNKEQNIQAYAKIQLFQSNFIVCITCQNQQMQIKLNGSYQDQLVEMIVSTFQGLFLKR